MSGGAEASSPSIGLRLDGIHVLLTRVDRDSQALAERLGQLGAIVHAMPTIAILPPKDFAGIDEAIRNLDNYDWIAFTSRNAVSAFFARCEAVGVAGTTTARFACVGTSTCEALEERGVAVHLKAEPSSARELGAALIKAGAQSKHVLLPVGDRARPELRLMLEGAGASVDAKVVYRTGLPQDSPTHELHALREGRIDVVVFASPSAVSNLVVMLKGDVSPLTHARITCMGPTTAETVTDYGLTVAAVAEDPSAQSLVEAVGAAGGRLK